MLESLLVACIVIVAAAYAAWAITPATTRKHLAIRAGTALGGPQAGGFKGMLAARLLALAKAPSGSCGDCPAHTPTPAERSGTDPRHDPR